MFTVVLLTSFGYFAYLLFASGLAPGVAFLTMSGELYTWYWYLVIVLGAIGVLLSICQALQLERLTRAMLSSRLSDFVLVTYGVIGILGWTQFLMSSVYFLLKAGLFLGGSYLLMTSGTLLSTEAATNFVLWKIIVGALLILLGLIWKVIYTYEYLQTTPHSYR